MFLSNNHPPSHVISENLLKIEVAGFCPATNNDDIDNGIELLNDRVNVIVSDFPDVFSFLAGDLNARIKE